MLVRKCVLFFYNYSGLYLWNAKLIYILYLKTNEKTRISVIKYIAFVVILGTLFQLEACKNIVLIRRSIWIKSWGNEIIPKEYINFANWMLTERGFEINMGTEITEWIDYRVLKTILYYDNILGKTLVKYLTLISNI